MLIGAGGELIGTVSGEGHIKLLEHNIERALARARDAGILAAAPLPLKPSTARDTPLRWPTKLIADKQRVVVVDSGHHRVLIGRVEENSLRITQVVGDLNAPQGAALRGDILWIADTGNHLVRRADLNTGTLTTVLGTGEKKFDHEAGKSGRGQTLNSPWDLAVMGNRLYVSQAGQHQIFAMNLMTGATEVAAGTAREDLRDGPAESANLAQPSGLSIDAATQTLYFADAQSSAVRALDLRNKTVSTLVGEGLFEFGDVDDCPAAARLKHPVGLCHTEHGILIADTANHKIKLAAPGVGVKTVRLPDTLQLCEPEGVAALGADELLIADTGNHRIVRMNRQTRAWQELPLVF